MVSGGLVRPAVHGGRELGALLGQKVRAEAVDARARERRLGGHVGEVRQRAVDHARLRSLDDGGLCIKHPS